MIRLELETDYETALAAAAAIVSAFGDYRLAADLLAGEVDSCHVAGVLADTAGILYVPVADDVCTLQLIGG